MSHRKFRTYIVNNYWMSVIRVGFPCFFHRNSIILILRLFPRISRLLTTMYEQKVSFISHWFFRTRSRKSRNVEKDIFIVVLEPPLFLVKFSSLASWRVSFEIRWRSKYTWPFGFDPLFADHGSQCLYNLLELTGITGKSQIYRLSSFRSSLLPFNDLSLEFLLDRRIVDMCSLMVKATLWSSCL